MALELFDAAGQRGQSNPPPVRRVLIFFEGTDGAGQITGCDLFAKDSSEPLESDDGEILTTFGGSLRSR